MSFGFDLKSIKENEISLHLTVLVCKLFARFASIFFLFLFFSVAGEIRIHSPRKNLVKMKQKSL